MPSAEHEDIVAMMAGGLGSDGLSVDEQRLVFESTASPAAADVCSEAVVANEVPAEWVTIKNAAPERALLYLHGGAYVMGSPATHRALAGHIARACNARVLLPDYRLAPEQPFPGAVEDAVACWRWLLASGEQAHNASIAGDSAGGGLALATLVALRDAGAALPACAVALSPWVDLEGNGPSAEPGVVDDPMLTREGLRASGQDYAADHLRDPLASPLLADLHGLPPLLLQVGTREILLSDSTRFAAKARDAAVDVTLDIEEGLIHVWHMLPGVPEAATAISRIGDFVRQHC